MRERRPSKATSAALVQGAATTQTTQALYPCEVVNCDPQLGEKLVYRLDLLDGRVTGPYPNKIDDGRTRNAIKTDLSYTIEDAWGQHSIKSGIEFADEKFEDKPINNAYYGAESTFTSIIGRYATYSGKEIKWDEALAADNSLLPDSFAWDATPKSVPGPDGQYPIAIPGQFDPYKA